MTAAAPESGPRTYGNWRRARGFGIGSLSSRPDLHPVRRDRRAAGGLLLLAARRAARRAGVGARPRRDAGPHRRLLADRRGRPPGPVLPGPVGGLDRAVRGAAHRPSPRRGPARADGADGAAVDRRRPRRQPGPAVGPPHRPADRGDPGQPGRAGPRRPRPRPTPGSPAFGGFLADLGLPADGPPRRDHRRHRARPAAPPCATTSPAGSTRPRRRRPGRCWTSSSTPPRPPAPTWTPGCRSPSTRPGPTPGPPTWSSAVAEVTRWLPGLEASLAAPGSRCWAGPASTG